MPGEPRLNDSVGSRVSTRDGWLKDGKLYVVAGTLGWACLIALESSGFNVTKGSDSLKWLLAAIFVLGVLLGGIKDGFERLASSLEAGVGDAQPILKQGFDELAAAVREVDARSGLRDVGDFLSFRLRYLEYSVSFRLSEDGDTDVDRNYFVRNISQEVVRSVSLPVYGFDALASDDPDELDVFRSLKVDGVPVERQLSSIRSSRFYEGSTYPGRPYCRIVEMSYRIPVTLLPGQATRIELSCEAPKSAHNIFDLIILGARVTEIVENLVISAAAPEGLSLSLMETSDYPQGVQVIDTNSKERASGEVERAPRPERVSDMAVFWKLQRPKIGKTYALRVKANRLSESTP